jgi:hypothetical protein
VIFVAFYLCFFGAMALTSVERWLTRKGGSRAALAPWLVAAVVVIAAGEVIGFSRVEYARTYQLPPIEAVVQPYHLVNVEAPQLVPPAAALHNFSIANCYEEAANPRSPSLRVGGGQAQVWVTPSRAGSAAITSRTVNTIAARVETTEPATIVLNQNYDPGWQGSRGEVVEWDGLLALRLAAGRHDVEVRYAPASFYVGAVTSAATASILLVLAGWELLRRRRQSLGVSPRPAAGAAGARSGWVGKSLRAEATKRALAPASTATSPAMAPWAASARAAAASPVPRTRRGEPARLPKSR